MKNLSIVVLFVLSSFSFSAAQAAEVTTIAGANFVEKAGDYICINADDDSTLQAAFDAAEKTAFITLKGLPRIVKVGSENITVQICLNGIAFTD